MTKFQHDLLSNDLLAPIGVSSGDTRQTQTQYCFLRWRWGKFFSGDVALLFLFSSWDQSGGNGLIFFSLPPPLLLLVRRWLFSTDWSGECRRHGLYRA